MNTNVHSPYNESQANCTVSGVVFFDRFSENVHMAYKPRHFLREWREASNKTLEQVAQAVEIIGSQKNEAVDNDLTYPDTMTHATLGRIETGKMPYKQQLLEILAEIYGTDVPSLIMRNPKIKDAPLNILDGLPKPQYEAVVNLINQIKATGTGG